MSVLTASTISSGCAISRCQSRSCRSHAYRQKVIYLVDALPFGCVFLHLVMDAIYVLCPPLNLSLNAVLLQLFADDIGHLCDIRLSHLALGVDEVGNELVLVRLQVSEG